MGVNKKPSYQVFNADLGYLVSKAKTYKRDTLRLKDNKFNSCTPSFHLLSSLVFELFPKVLIGYEICIKHKDNTSITEEDIREEIRKKMRGYNHHLDKLYKKFPDLMEYLDINEISEFKGDYVWEYRVKLNASEGEVLLKDFEAIRYGSFANSKDVLTLCIYDEVIITLLEKLEKYIEKKCKETRKILEN